MIQYDLVQNIADLEQILSLQAENLPQYISPEEQAREGFVTVHHDLELLQSMNNPYPHIIARAEGQIIAYALVMLPHMGDRIPVLRSMFELINQLEFRGQALAEAAYFVMGQICIQKAYRGQGIFAGLYEKMRQEMRGDFDYIITEVATRNGRSIRAHEKVGFQNIKTYQVEGEEEWDLLLLDISSPS